MSTLRNTHPLSAPLGLPHNPWPPCGPGQSRSRQGAAAVCCLQCGISSAPGPAQLATSAVSAGLQAPEAARVPGPPPCSAATAQGAAGALTRAWPRWPASRVLDPPPHQSESKFPARGVRAETAPPHNFLSPREPRAGAWTLLQDRRPQVQPGLGSGAAEQRGHPGLERQEHLPAVGAALPSGTCADTVGPTLPSGTRAHPVGSTPAALLGPPSSDTTSAPAPLVQRRDTGRTAPTGTAPTLLLRVPLSSGASYPRDRRRQAGPPGSERRFN